MKSKSKKILSILLAFAIVSAIFAAIPMTAQAENIDVIIMAGDNVAQIKQKIEDAFYKSTYGDTVTVKGAAINGNTLSLDIYSGLTVIWQADYSGNDAESMIVLYGSGYFEIVTGGSIRNTGNGGAIWAGGDTQIKVSGGTVNSAKGYAVCAISENFKITVSGGEVRGENAIYTTGVNSAVNIIGGVIESTGTLGAAICNKGNNSVINLSGGTINGNKVRAIDNQSANSTININGGIVNAADDEATISTQGDNSVVNISGGVISNTGNNSAILASNYQDLNITGGFIFGYGIYISGNRLSRLCIIGLLSDGTCEIGGNAVVCAWDKPYGGIATYLEGQSDLLIVNTGSTVKWAKKGTQSGLSYSNGSNVGFFPLDGVIVKSNAKPQTVKVINGKGGGSYDEGATVNITADAAPAGKVFDKWTTSDSIVFADATKANTSFVMPSTPVTVTANYKDLPPEPTKPKPEPEQESAPEPDIRDFMSNFTRKRTFIPEMFADVNETAWYGYYVQKVIANAYEYGLMQGNGAVTFNPTGNITIAEAITIAARVHSIYSTGAENFKQGGVWYQVYIDYALASGIIKINDFTDYNRAATRAEMTYIFSCSLPESEFPAQNTVNLLPDVNSGTPYYYPIMLFYKAGILIGNDTAGTFSPGNNITRAEAAAIISRVILPAIRINGKTYSYDYPNF